MDNCKIPLSPPFTKGEDKKNGTTINQSFPKDFLSKFRNLGLLFIAAMIVWGVVKIFVKDMAKGRHSSGNPAAQTAGAEWHRHSIGGLSLATPGALKPLQIEASKETRDALKLNEAIHILETALP